VNFGARSPDPKKELSRARTQLVADHRRAAITATDRAARESQTDIRQKMASMRLGKLGNAVGQTSLLRQRGQGDPYGVIYARGGDESITGGALEAYSRGVTIEPKDGNQWLWFQTSAIPRRVGRYRMTPARFRASGLMGSIGKLEFRPLGPNRAALVIKRVSLSPKDGRAKALGPRSTRTRIPQKEIIAFIGIRVTRRAQRFDKDQIVFARARRVPFYIVEALDALSAGRRG
jgi:hypothetical protein